MTFNKSALAIFIVLASALLGCSRIDDEILATGRCYRAAMHLNDRELLTASEIELSKLAARLAEASPGRPFVFGEFKSKIDAELQPQGTSTPTDHMLRVVLKWQSSSHCSAIRERALRVN